MTRTTTSWADDRIDADLRQFLADRAVWPSYAEFVAAGRAGLRQAITQHGGACMWASRMGVEWVERRPGYAPRWTAKRVRSELESFLAGRTVWPSRKEFETAGLKTLRDAVHRLGGVDVWAAEFGLQRTSRASGSIRAWNEQHLERAIRPLVEQVGRWPTAVEFRRAGLLSALTAVYSYEGVLWWQQRLGVDSSPRRGPVPDRRIWTDEEIERQLRAYCGEFGVWPPWQRFVADGKAKLYRAASMHGGVGRWQLLLGLSRPRRARTRGTG
jgi:hypothetical protein